MSWFFCINRSVYLLTFALIGCGAMLVSSALAEGPARRLSTEELSGVWRMVGGDGFTLSPADTVLLASTNRGMGFWTLPDASPHDVNASDEALWRLSDESSYAFTPDDARVAAPMWIDGKPWIGVGDLRAGEQPRRVLQIPKDFFGIKVAGWSPDGQGVYLLLSYRLQRHRADPRDDNPPTRNVNVELRLSRHYQTRRQDPPRIPPAYEGAVAGTVRDFIAYYHFETKELRRLFTGNDVEFLLFSPDKSRVLAMQRRPDFSADVYAIPMPEIAACPMLNLETAKEEERNAGWFDAQGARLTPVLSQVGINGYSERTVIAWAPTNDRFTYAASTEAGAMSVFVHDLRSQRSTNLTTRLDFSKVSWRLPAELVGGEEPTFTTSWFSVGNPPRWMPDGESVLMTGRGHLWRIPVQEDRPIIDLTPADAPALMRVISRNADGDVAALIAPDEVLLHAVARDGLRDAVLRLNLQTGRWQSLYESKGLITKVVATADMSALYFNETERDDVRQVRCLALTGERTVATISKFAEEVPQRVHPEALLFPFTTPSSGAGYAHLHFPFSSAAGEKLPMVVLHESFGRALPKWRSGGVDVYNNVVQMWNQAGYAVLVVDAPALAESGDGRWINPLAAITEGFLAATDIAVATGRIDEQKLVLFGEGGDSYLVQGVIGRTTRYRAAAVFRGFGETAFAGLVLDPVGMRGLASGWYVENPQRYLELSPVSRFAQVKTPLLIIAQQDGDASHLAGAESFGALVVTGTQTILATYNKYPGPELFQRVRTWFDEHLNNAPVLSNRATLPVSVSTVGAKAAGPTPVDTTTNRKP